MMARNLAQPKREACTRERLASLPEARIAGSDGLDADSREDLWGASEIGGAR